MPPNNGPSYFFDAALGRFRSSKTGRAVSGAFVRQEVDVAIRRSSAEVGALMQRLRAGAIDVATWRVAMMEQIKLGHLAAAMVAMGGRDMMSADDFLRVGAEVATQYTYLARFASDLEAGVVRADARAGARASSYLAAVRSTYLQVDREQRATTYDQEANVLGAAEHCPQCLDVTALGWVPIGTLPAIGTRLCTIHDRCHLIFRNSQTGRVAP